MGQVPEAVSSVPGLPATPAAAATDLAEIVPTQGQAAFVSTPGRGAPMELEVWKAMAAALGLETPSVLVFSQRRLRCLYGCFPLICSGQAPPFSPVWAQQTQSRNMVAQGSRLRS